MPDNDNLKAARAKKEQNAQKRAATKSEMADAILADPAINEELRRKLAYVQRELKRDRDGKAALMTRRDELVREARRRYRPPSDSA